MTDAQSGEAVAGASVSVPALGVGTLSDAAGAFRLRGLEPGEHEVHVSRIGYRPRSERVRVENAQAARLSVALEPEAVALTEVRAAAEARGSAAGHRIGRSEIERSGARTAGDVVARAPGVTVVGRGAGAEQTVRIRGAGADAVLVLLDGVALNDPVTGEADLSSVPADQVESVTVLPGARGARYGPRAEAGVVLIETRAPAGGLAGALAAGTLGERGASAEWGGGTTEAGWSAGARARALDGEFEFPRVAGVDSRPVRRTNADIAEWSGWAAARAPLAGGALDARASAETLERGLPGRGYAPSVHARQQLERVRAGARWRHETARAPGALARTSLALDAVSQGVLYADPDPPFGLPYHERTRVRTAGARGEWERLDTRGWLGGRVVGAELRLQHVDAGALAESAPRRRLDAGVFARAQAALLERAGARLGLDAEARLDRDPVAERLYGSHALTLALERGAAGLYLAHRSSYSPPALGDQFFRAGVGVAPNPDLRAERVPSEWELGGRAAAEWGALRAAAGGSAYRGDIRGMIVWLPDFRFVWSPRNTDVNRRGAEVWGELEWPRRALSLSGQYALARVTYDRPHGEPVQVAYRPRHEARLAARWAPEPWSAGLEARYLGARYPVPAAVNRLPGFWTLDLALERRWRFGDWALNTALHVDRLLDREHSLIFGYPEPGRRVLLDLRAALPR